MFHVHQFLSRKFLLAVGSVVAFVAQKQYTQAVAIVLGYLGVEGYADVASRKV